MLMRKKMVLKVLASLLLLVVATGIAYIMKDVLSARQPLNALPSIQIYYDDRLLPEQHVELASYSWRFFNTTKKDVFVTEEQLGQLPAAPVIASTPLDIGFSFPCKEMKISRAANGSLEFFDIATAGTAEDVPEETAGTRGKDSVRLRTPADPGEYTYRVEATWGVRGSVQYYFKIVVPNYTE